MEVQALQPREPSKSDTKFSSHDVEIKKVSAYATNEDLSSEFSRISLAKIRFADLKRKLLVLDINGLLADIVPHPVKDHKADKIIKRQAIFVRPFLHEFLKFCFDKFEVAIWSSRKRKNVDPIIDFLMGDMENKLIFFWDRSHCVKTRFNIPGNKYKKVVFKDLRRLWQKHDPNLPWDKGYYNESNTLLLDDSSYKGLLNPLHTSVFPHTFSYKNTGDNSLAEGGDLRKYLDELANVEDMQKYVEKHPFGQECINETSEYWDFYLKVVKNCYRTFKKNNNTYNSRYRQNIGYWKEKRIMKKESDSEAKRELIGSIEENDQEVKHEVEDYETLMERKEIN